MVQTLSRIFILVVFTIIILHPIVYIHKYGSFLLKPDKDTGFAKNLKLTLKKKYCNKQEKIKSIISIKSYISV